MGTNLQISTALISVYHKDGLRPIVEKLNALGVKIYSTGGTQKFINDLGIDVIPVEEITEYPSILGGRVKTLHPKIFGGILNRKEDKGDVAQMESYNIPQIDLVIVDLYPFERTVASEANEVEIIEKIDIGGISLIRAAAKNFRDTICISSIDDYPEFLRILSADEPISVETRKYFAARAFNISSQYDTAIFNYFNGSINNEKKISALKISKTDGMELRYGENPHQKGYFFGDFESLFDKIHGKELSYNNLLDVDAAVNLMAEFRDEKPTFAILKHNNACGIAQRDTVKQAYVDALAGDPVSAFGGILITNTEIDTETATEIDKLFCEVVISSSYSAKALDILKAKKNRVILVQKEMKLPQEQIRTCLNGFLLQEKDNLTDNDKQLNYVTDNKPSAKELRDLLFASKICKHTKSNTIVLLKDLQLCASGTGQTSRVDALKQAVEKAKSFKFDLKGAVMASDAFFPFPDCVEIAGKAGITAVIQPGGSIKDTLSIDYCNAHKMAMVFTSTRHFKH